MMNSSESATLIAELNDLLKLDRDAVEGYDIALGSLENEGFRETLRLFRADHERHVAELISLIRAAGGSPSETGHLTSGIFKSVLQQVGRLGGDTGILFAFEANERQVRDKYWRYADSTKPAPVKTVIRRAAEDEDRHYTWAVETLKRLSADPMKLPPRVQSLLEQVYGLTGDLLESVERTVEEQLGKRRPGG